MKHVKEGSSPSAASAKDKSKQSLTQPYIREVALGSDRLPIAIANGGFTVIVPSITNPSYNRVLIYLKTGEGTPYPIPIKDAFLQHGVDTTLTYTSAEIDNQFNVNDAVKIHSSFWFVSGEFWTNGPESIVYTVVA